MPDSAKSKCPRCGAESLVFSRDATLGELVTVHCTSCGFGRLDAPQTPQCCQDVAGRIAALEKRVDALEAAQPYQKRNALDGMDIWAGD